MLLVGEYLSLVTDRIDRLNAGARYCKNKQKRTKCGQLKQQLESSLFIIISIRDVVSLAKDVTTRTDSSSRSSSFLFLLLL